MATPKKYVLTPEHEAQLPAWRDKWVANALSTAPMTDEDRTITTDAVRGMYAAADLSAPKVIFTPSPFVARFAAGFACAHLWMRQNPTHEITTAYLPAQPYTPTHPVLKATQVALSEALDTPLVAGPDLPARADFAPPVDWYRGVGDMKALAISEFGAEVAPFALACAQMVYRGWSGGNQWSGYVAELSFYRYVAKLGETHGIDYSRWDHYEKACLHSGPRIMYPAFCMVSDRPRVLTTEPETPDNRPHNTTGCFCQWSDGSALYAVHGVRMPYDVIEFPESLTPERITNEENAERKRIMVTLYGPDRYLQDSNAKRVQADDAGELYRIETGEDEEPIQFVKVINSTPEPDGSFKPYYLAVPPTITTALEGVAWTFEETPETYAPLMQT